MSNQITVRDTGSGFSVVITPEAEIQKTGALAKAERIRQVTNPEELESAIMAAAILKGITKEVEGTRKLIKQPFLDAGSEIDVRAAEYVRDINRRTAEIEQLASNYQAELQRKADDARREQEREQREADAAAQAERDKLEELERQRAEATESMPDGKRKLDEINRWETKIQQAEIDAAEAKDTAEETARTVIAEPPKVTGGSVRPTYDFEVTDIEAFYRWDRDRRAVMPSRILPSYVKMEVRRQDFLDYIKLLPDDFDRIPGIKIIRRIEVHARSVAPSIALPR